MAWVKRTAGRWILRLLSTTIILLILATAGIFYAFWHYGRDLPEFEKLADYEPPIVSRLYAGNGRLIGEFASEKRIFVPYARIPKRVINAFVASEDQRFFTHSGIDFMGLVRAAWTNLTNLGSKRLVGGSTITQQVAKNFLLTSEKTLERKIKEFLLAWRIEKNLSKPQILELYMNQIFLGRRAYGVAAAAQSYFGKDLRDLTVAEAAFLAGLPQAPSRYDPDKAHKIALRRRNYVISRMRIDGYITAAAAEAALKSPLKTIKEPPYISLGQEYFVEEVRRLMLAKYGDKKMTSGGYVIRSTLDPKLQKFADEALRNGLVAYDRRHGYRGPVTNLKDGKGEGWAAGWKKKLAKIALPKGHGTWPLAVVLEVSVREAVVGFADGSRGRIPLAEVPVGATPEGTRLQMGWQDHQDRCRSDTAKGRPGSQAGRCDPAGEGFSDQCGKALSRGYL